MIDVDISLEPYVTRSKDHVHNFTKGFNVFITSKDVTRRDITRSEEKNKKNSIILITHKNEILVELEHKLLKF